MTIHFGPPHGLILQSEETKNPSIPGLPPGTILLKQMTSVARVGLPCSPAFAMTDYKSQPKPFENVMVDLRGRQATTSGPSKCDFMSLYVQLSQATHWDGIRLSSEVQREDFIDPVNRIDDRLQRGVENLESLADRTWVSFEERGRREWEGTDWFKS